MMMFSAGKMVVFWLMLMKALFDDKLFILLSMFNILISFNLSGMRRTNKYSRGIC
jgi:hypothetical protein